MTDNKSINEFSYFYHVKKQIPYITSWQTLYLLNLSMWAKSVRQYECVHANSEHHSIHRAANVAGCSLGNKSAAVWFQCHVTGSVQVRSSPGVAPGVCLYTRPGPRSDSLRLSACFSSWFPPVTGSVCRSAEIWSDVLHFCKQKTGTRQQRKPAI